jgi:hypothetical protein
MQISKGVLGMFFAIDNKNRNEYNQVYKNLSRLDDPKIMKEAK